MKLMRVGVIIVFLLSLAAFLVSASVYREKGEEKMLRLGAESKLSEERKLKQSLEVQLEDAEAARAKVEGQLVGRDGQIVELKDQIQAAMKREQELLEQVTRRDQEIERLLGDISGLSAHKEGLQSDIERSRRRTEGLRYELNEIRQAKQALEKRFDIPQPVQESAGVELEKIVVRVEPKALSGRVLVVNEEFNFVITNLGKRDQLSLGDALEVVREGAVVGRAQVEKLYESMSAATILPEGRELDIQEGDYVRKI